MAKDQFVLAQVSDLHFGDARFDPVLALAVADEINELKPDVLVVAGDLTERGYREQFDEAVEWLDSITCATRLVIPGNHDARNVGYVHFAEILGPRYSSQMLDLGGERVLLLGVDTSKPDLNQGELGRVRHHWLYEQCTQQADFKILALHHHLVSVPGTGRERNILLDAGDIIEILAETGVDLVLCGHKHVPYVWEMAGMTLSTSGTAFTKRTRGKIPPSFSIVHVEPERIVISMRNSGQSTSRTAVVPRRRPHENAVTGRRRGLQAAEAGAHIGMLS
jgi:3',5'-cyclic AMP phosphodiesterase CpdA